MESKELVQAIEKAILEVESNLHGGYTQACELLRLYAGPKSSFFSQIQEYNPKRMMALPSQANTVSLLKTFKNFIESGYSQGISPERKGQLDVVSDFLEQANQLLRDTKIHPAAPAILIGATLEEFLRTWAEAEGLNLDSKQSSIDSYAKILRESEIISKQDIKDITAWTGIRNDAAHGNWDNVKDKERIQIMLEGVNLFLRKYSKV
ncbi:MAG: hypothetical protein ACYC5N_05790 [Endomicrobiales bacterium]